MFLALHYLLKIKIILTNLTKITYNHVWKRCIGKIIITEQNETEAKKYEVLYIRNDRDNIDIADKNIDKCKNILNESKKIIIKLLLKN